ncbi:MAG TPA: DNA topoisomerase IV subunit A [Rectinemataceae bacterium]|nr:DNA topoisomerase IV subunit A [Rectinemataceae bacterium]
MAYVKKIFDQNYLYYASYVIKDRAIPDLEDGLKPVQRRILHSLFELDDGKFHKVANVVGHCMKYHPHGDQSIYSALVVLANKELFIDKQGNFGNIATGDEASAARYIECRARPLARELLYNPKITDYAESYDGRNKEPIVFPAKIPVVLALGAEGIAVGMSTKILPHNPVEVIRAEIAALKGKKFKLEPDFPTGGLCDASAYADGAGKVRVRAKLDLSDEKRIVIRELPFGSTTDSLISSVESAAKAGRIKIASISDFTTDKVEIEIKLQRGVYAKDIVDALYAFTECEQSISCNLLVIKDEMPVVTTVGEVVRHHAARLLDILKRELELEVGELLDELHARTLERIFIEERVYKGIEKMKTQESVRTAVLAGLEGFKKEIRRQVTDEDVERLLKIPIRRISLYDINRAKDEMDAIKAKLAQARKHLAALVDYAISFLEQVAGKLAKDWPRKTELASFSQVDVKEAARRDLPLRYDQASGYLGTAVSGGETLFTVSSYDKILVIRRNGVYTALTVPEKLFVDQGMLYCGSADKEELAKTLFTIVYKDAGSGFAHIKRCRIETYVTNRDYMLIPDGAQILFFTTQGEAEFTLKYAPKPRMKIKEESFKAGDFEEKGLKAQGVRLAAKESLSVLPGRTAAGSRAAAARDTELFDAKADRTGSQSRLKKAGAKGRQESKTPPRGLKARAEDLVRTGGAAKAAPKTRAASSAKAGTEKNAAARKGAASKTRKASTKKS